MELNNIRLSDKSRQNVSNMSVNTEVWHILLRKILRYCHIKIYLVLYLVIIHVLCKSTAPLSFGELVVTPFYASMHWAIEPPVRASRGDRQTERKTYSPSPSLFIRYQYHSNLLLSIIVLFSLFWGEFYLLNFLYIYIYIWYMMPVVCKIYICMDKYIIVFYIPVLS